MRSINMRIIIWKKNVELRNSVIKKIMLLIIPLIIGWINIFVLRFNGKQLCLFTPIAICGWMHMIFYCIDDISCASLYNMIGIKTLDRWLGNIFYCEIWGNLFSIIIVFFYICKYLEFEMECIIIFICTIPIGMILIGLSTIHFLSNSRKEQLLASCFSIMIIASEWIFAFGQGKILRNINVWGVGIIAMFSLFIFIFVAKYINSNENHEQLIYNSHIYIDSYDKNFFQE